MTRGFVVLGFKTIQSHSILIPTQCGIKCGNVGLLNATKIKSLKDAGRYGDGDGLFLVITKNGGRSWVLRVQKNGKRRDIGLGSAKSTTLAMARDAAAKMRTQIASDIDPVAERKKAAGVPTFKELALKMLEHSEHSWRNDKHKAQWHSTLNTYVFPKIGNLQIDKIEAPDIRECIKPIWIEKHVTAKRVLQRILSVLNWADGEGFIDTNISRAKILKGFRKPKDSEPKHHPALPFKEVSDFINRLRERRSVGRLAFELLILTATRSGEVRNAVWSEIDLKEKLWTIPAERMKAGNEHIIPLSDEAISVLETAKFYREARSDIIFPGIRSGRAMSDMTLTKICRDMKIEAVPHGFRSSFRDWVAECTSFEPEVAEMALAHTIANKVEAAYRLHHINCHRLRKAVHASGDVA